MTEKKQEEKFYVVEAKTLAKNIRICKETRSKLVSLLKQYVSDDTNLYQREIVDLLCEQVCNIKYMLAQINFIISEGEVYKDKEKGIEGFKITLKDFTMMKNYMAINLLCETDLLKHSISLQSC
jgi:hypothetical protein